MGKVLRFIGIVFMGLTAAFTILGGVGTTCVALGAENYPSMAGIAPFKWLYVIFVIVTTAIGVMMVRATVLLVQGRSNAYRYAVISLVLGILIGAIHMVASRILRDSSMPVDAVTYTAVLTLIIFLIFRIPSIWERVDFSKSKTTENQNAGGAAAIVAGALGLSIQTLMASTHTMNGGINYADAFNLTMTLSGWLLITMGISLILHPLINRQGIFGRLQKSTN